MSENRNRRKRKDRQEKARRPTRHRGFALPRRIRWPYASFFGGVFLLIGIPLFLVVEMAASGGVWSRSGLARVNLAMMSNFTFDQATGISADIPKRYRDLDGKRVTLVGQMWSSYGAGGNVRAFNLVSSRRSCCFSGPPLVQHFVKVTSPEGAGGVDFRDDFVTATGILHVGVEIAAGQIQSIYRMDLESLNPG